MPGYIIQPKTKEPEYDIVYLHGGAFLFEITPHHYNLIAELAERLNARFHVAIYPLAPEHGADEVHGKMLELLRTFAKGKTAATADIHGRFCGCKSGACDGAYCS